MMNALIVLLGCLATALAVPANFPHGKTVTYKYTVDIKSALIEPVPFASTFAIDCTLRITHDTTDPTLKNAYYAALTDVKHSMHNGQRQTHEHLEHMLPIDIHATAIQDPFLIVFNENGQLQGVKFVESDREWSRNVKTAIASMVQLDLINIHVETTMKPHGFMTHEKTIHGTCEVEYNVQPTTVVQSTNTFTVTKFHEPKNCSHFVQHMFDHVETLPCHVPEEETLSTSAVRWFEIENQGADILIRKVNAQGVISHIPWLGNTEAHYLMTNQTMILESVLPMPDKISVNFQNIAINREMTYHATHQKYSGTGDLDLTQTRHTVHLETIVSKVKKMLNEAADYLKEDHLTNAQPDWKHGQTINRLLSIMGYMDVDSFEQVFNSLHQSTDAKQVIMKNIFLGIVPKVGTTAACHFVRNVIRQKHVPDTTAIIMLSKLPMSVKLPTELLLTEMEELLRLGEYVSVDVKKASILCFATLIHKTFKTERVGEVVQNSLLDRYLWYFMDHITNEQTYHMKEVYMMAMKNVALGNIMQHLEPIIRGNLLISEKPINIRVQAIWAIKKVVMHQPQYTHDLLWPILTNVQLPLHVRIVAYDVLMTQLSHLNLMKMYWFMAYEKNEHLYHYHFTTLQGLAKSDDPCHIPVQEMAKKILRFTRTVDAHKPSLSSVWFFNMFEEKFGYSETFKASTVTNSLTGLPDVGSLEHFTTHDRKPVNEWGIHWHITGLDEVYKQLTKTVLGSTETELTNSNVKNVLFKALQDMPRQQHVYMDICLTVNDNVVMVFNYDHNEWSQLLTTLEKWTDYISNVSWQNLYLDNLREIHVPTDAGVQAVIVKRTPNLDSIKMKTDRTAEQSVLYFKLQFDYRNWRHGENVMSIYNPIADVWHSVRRTSSRDAVLSTEMNFSLNIAQKSFKLTLPRLPITQYSISGLSTHTKNYVTITNDDSDILKKFCDTCHHHEMVTSTLTPKKSYQNIIDSKDVGLRFTTTVSDCEGNTTPISPVAAWLNSIPIKQLDNWDQLLTHFTMGIRKQMVNDLISSQGASCSNLIRIEPSIIHSTSNIDLSGKISVEDMDPQHEQLQYWNSLKVNIRGTLDAKAAATNESVRQWNANVNVDFPQGHTSNTMKVQITRLTKGAKNLKICIDAQKTYPTAEADILKVDSSKEETNTKMKITMGETSEDKCVRDDMDVTVTIKGQVSENQDKHIMHEKIQEICNKQKQNPLFTTQAGYIPRTRECIQTAIHHSSLRKYTTDIAYRKVPAGVMSMAMHLQTLLVGLFFPQVTYNWDHVEPGNIRLNLEYPFSTSVLDMSVTTPTHGYQLVNLPFGHKVWHPMMDNTHFSYTQLDSLINESTKMCTLYYLVTVNFDNGITPFVFPPLWTLISGDYVNYSYAIFVKSVQNNKLAVKMMVSQHDIEIMPIESKLRITVDGTPVENLEKGMMIPSDAPETFALKWAKHMEQFTIQSKQVPVTLFYAIDSITILVDNKLRGRVSGLCGHMDDTHRVALPKVYSAPHF